MNATRTPEQSQDSQGQYTKLDDRYGEIGISAVAAAVCHRSGERKANAIRFVPYDSD